MSKLYKPYMFLEQNPVDQKFKLNVLIQLEDEKKARFEKEKGDFPAADRAAGTYKSESREFKIIIEDHPNFHNNGPIHLESDAFDLDPTEKYYIVTTSINGNPDEGGVGSYEGGG